MISTHTAFNRAAGQQVASLMAHLRQHMAQCGYELIDLPIMQQADLFLTKAGDQIIERLFTFERGGKEWALRPEFTAAAAHLYSQTQPANTIVRWQFAGPIFEEDPNRWMQEYQYLSIGAELIGAGGAMADAEMMALSLGGLAACDIPDSRIVIGHMGLLRQVLSQFRLDARTEHFILHQLKTLFNQDEGKAAVLEQLNSILGNTPTKTAPVFPPPSPTTTLIGGRTVKEIEHRLARKQRRASEQESVNAALDALLEWGKIQGDANSVFRHLQVQANTPSLKETLNQWQSTLNLLSAYDIPESSIQLQPGLVRSWEYYTGFVFELYGKNEHLGGGGRYDELVELVGGANQVPAVGFVYYGDKLARTVSPHMPSGITLPICSTAGQEMLAIRWAQALRKRGHTVVLSDQGYAVTEQGLLRFQNRIYSLENIDQLEKDLATQAGVNS